MNQKLEKLIDLAEQQMEDKASMKGEIASLRAEVSKLKKEKEWSDTKNTKRNSMKLPTDLSVSTTGYSICNNWRCGGFCYDKCNPKSAYVGLQSHSHERDFLGGF